MFVFFFHIRNENFTILGMRDYLFFFFVWHSLNGKSASFL